MTYYVLVGRTPFAVDARTWANAFEKRRALARVGAPDPWVVGKAQINDHCNVSTVFLGLDHNFAADDDPVLFETLVFGGPCDREMRRYRTWVEAERGHEATVTEVKIACAKIKAIADASGAR